ncbi:DUF4282 domain-containing protein [Desulfosporosinus sp. BG]|uniref:DUF4282 domain-containing protein n=1 Tax=Desulfosporosinus sp. BG TaxID=1633135 RepID=UPI000857D571|nr:DUF4282 domain-containing protein [Desulfosporosinus sp. BG]ODA39785.1 hypothetical protein DSBG_3451 [Desulfosporosinus sp. BG]
MKHGSKGEYSPEAFEVIVDLLKEQEKTILAQSKHSEIAEEESNNISLSDFFSFRLLISTRLIKFLYFWGVIGITIVSWNLFMKDQLLIGILSIIVGNAVWRLICEMVIIFFRMNKQLAQLCLTHQELKRSIHNPN